LPQRFLLQNTVFWLMPGGISGRSVSRSFQTSLPIHHHIFPLSVSTICWWLEATVQTLEVPLYFPLSFKLWYFPCHWVTCFSSVSHEICCSSHEQSPSFNHTFWDTTIVITVQSLGGRLPVTPAQWRWRAHRYTW